MHVRGEHVRRALESASDGPVAEGNVGSGTGMICHGFKGGIGTSSRVLPEEVGGYVVGVLVQANQGQRERLRVNGLPVGAQIPVDEVPSPGAFDDAARSSIIVVVATDAPLLPAQCTRLAQRAGLGVARMGGVGENFSGDLFIAFATGNERLPPNDYADDAPVTVPLEMVANRWITPFFEAVIDATEEAILNALLAAETMTGRDGITAYGLEAERLTEALEHLGHGSSGHS
jgi:D-aminopeptidase